MGCALQEGLDAATATAVMTWLFKEKKAPEVDIVRARVQRFKGVYPDAYDCIGTLVLLTVAPSSSEPCSQPDTGPCQWTNDSTHCTLGYWSNKQSFACMEGPSLLSCVCDLCYACSRVPYIKSCLLASLLLLLPPITPPCSCHCPLPSTIHAPLVAQVSPSPSQC